MTATPDNSGESDTSDLSDATARAQAHADLVEKIEEQRAAYYKDDSPLVADAEYDDKIIGRIDKLVARLDPLIDALAAHDPRFARYATRFAAATGQIDAGRHEYVSSPTLDSVHTVWFEFHEDLLRTLGRDRTE